MEIGINDLDFEDDELDSGSQTQPTGYESGEGFEDKPYMDGSELNYPEPTQSADSSSSEEDLISQLLQRQGIKDKNSIKFENEDGSMESRSWDDLSAEEQLNILDTPKTSPEYDLDDQEIALINQLRQAAIDPTTYADLLRREGAQYALQNQSQQEPAYEIDDIKDDELFILDLKAKSPDLTDEELIQQLTTAQANPETFQKVVGGIRNQYRDIENQERARQQQEIEWVRQQEYNEFSEQVVDGIQRFNELNTIGIELSPEEQQQLAEFLLGTDATGENYFSKALQDPDMLISMAWFAQHGKDAIDSIQQYYNNEISNVRRYAYNKGLEDAKAGKASAHVVVKKADPKTSITAFNKSGELSIDDLD